VITRGIRDFMTRDWAAARESKVRYWGERIARLGPSEALRIADELRRQMRLRDPAWPDAVARRGDLEAHIRYSERMQRAGTACRR
jgi:hypothetical protein